MDNSHSNILNLDTVNLNTIVEAAVASLGYTDEPVVEVAQRYDRQGYWQHSHLPHSNDNHYASDTDDYEVMIQVVIPHGTPEWDHVNAVAETLRAEAVEKTKQDLLKRKAALAREGAALDLLLEAYNQ